MALFRNEISSNEKGEITTTALRRPSFEYTRIITSASQSSSSLVLLLRCFSKDVPYFFIHSSLFLSLSSTIISPRLEHALEMMEDKTHQRMAIEQRSDWLLALRV